MEIEYDVVLQQVKEIEVLLEEGNVDEVSQAIYGLKRILLNFKAKENPIQLKRSSVDFDKIEDTYNEIQTNGCNINCVHPIGQIDETWGWYDEQVDKNGNCYRWCGQYPESGFCFSPTSCNLAAIAVPLFPVDPKNFRKNSLSVRVNGKPMPFHLSSAEGRVPLLLIGLADLESYDRLDVRFYLHQRTRPVEAGISSDCRQLAFNISKVFEIDTEYSKFRQGLGLKKLKELGAYVKRVKT